MRIVKCDKHPDRDAVVTLNIKEVPLGTRPILLGVELPKYVVDLCDECRSAILISDDTSNSEDDDAS